MSSPVPEVGKTCFVARPISMTEDAAALYGGDRLHWRHVEESLILPTLEATGYVHIPTPGKGAGLIHAHVIEAVNGADLVIADFSQLNPNVFFEAGVRTAVNRPLLVIAEEGTKLPFDTAGINTWFYDPRLPHWEISAMITDLVQHIEDTKTEGNELWTRFGERLQAQEFAATRPGDPTAAAIEQISIDVRDLKQSQVELERRLSGPRDESRTISSSMNARVRVDRAIERLIGDLLAADASADLISEVDARFAALLRTDVVLALHLNGTCCWMITELVDQSSATISLPNINNLTLFRKAYTKYVDSVRRDYGRSV